jgi:type VI secretion system protein ImpK
VNRVNEVTKDCFNALIQLRSVGQGAGARPEHVYQRLQAYVDEAIARGKSMQMAESDLADIMYAIVAHADELAQQKPGPLRDYWHARPLQLRYFGENVAGDGLFERLNRILQDPSRVEALSVYHQVLAFGFEGRYAIRGGELELDMIRRRVRDNLGRLLNPEPVSRSHLPKRESLQSRRMDFLVLWIGLFALLFSVCFIIALRVSLNGLTDNVDGRGRVLLQQLAGDDAADEAKEGAQ